MIINKDVKYISKEINNLGIGILQLMCLETHYKEGEKKIDKDVNTIVGKENIRHRRNGSSQKKKGFRFLYIGLFSY